jgi:cytochrome P450
MLLDGDADDALIRDQLVGVSIGAVEPVAIGAAWVFERLLRHPDALAKVRAGLDDPGDTYLAAAVKEAMRVRPTSIGPRRFLSEDVELGGRRLPAGTVVLASMSALTTDPRVWGADAEQFRPERWLKPDVPRQFWLPFGGGTHRCIGAGYAQIAVETIVRTVLRLVDLRPDRLRDERRSYRLIQMLPARGARVRIQSRLSVSGSDLHH